MMELKEKDKYLEDSKLGVKDNIDGIRKCSIEETNLIRPQTDFISPTEAKQSQEFTDEKTQIKLEFNIRDNAEKLNSDNSQLEEIVQQRVNDKAETKNIIKISETGNGNLNENNLTVNLENNYGFSENNLILDSKTVVRFSPKWKQFIAAMGPILMIFSAGMSSGYSAILLPQLKEEQSVITSNRHSPSWIASMTALPMAPGCIIGGWLMEKLGRRYALRILSIPFFVGWILIATAPNLTLMLLGRLLNGVSIGLLAPPMSVFISESSSPELRGMFLAFLSFSLAVGIFVSHVIGTFMSWRWTAGICAFFPICSAALLSFIPESPVWLLAKGKTEDGIKSFYWLRGYDDDVKTELKAMVDKFKTVEKSSVLPWKEKLTNYYTPQFWKPLLLMIIIYSTCQYSGVHAITFYSVDIIERSVGKGIDNYVVMLTIDSIRVITALIASLTSRRCPRRTLCMISGSLTSMSMIGLSMFLYFYNNKIPPRLTPIPLCFLSAYIIAVNIGLMPLPWIIVGEIFPAKVRSVGAGVASAVGFFSTFVVVKTAPGMMEDLGEVATFMFYGIVAMAGTVILYFILPETKDRSLVEIEAMYVQKKQAQK